jgi:uncharacterized protein (TIGR03663 family)
MSAESIASPLKTRNDRWLDKAVFPWWPNFTVEQLLIALIILLTLITRFYDLGARTMAHDEINHVVPSYTIENYVYDPVTHGPFQFHALALSYFLFGDSDFSARIPAALFGIGVVLFTLFAWRRYLGRVGSLCAATLFMISPYILFYSRYTRNEIFIVFWGLVMLWLLLRYMEDGQSKWLYWLVFITAMHYADKATSYIFTAEASIFLALLFIIEALRRSWKSKNSKNRFQIAVVVTLALILVTVGVYVLGRTPAPMQTGETTHLINSKLPLIASAGAMAISAVAAIVFLVQGLGWEQIRSSRTFDLIVLPLILILPLLIALPLSILGFDATDYSQNGIIRSGIAFSLLGLASLVLGTLWNRKTFLRSAAIFWGIFIVFYTTFFSHGEGFFKGIVGALGYWMQQQAVERGTQPLYYYALVQIPVYEYLPALGTILALVIGIFRRLFRAKVDEPFSHVESTPIESEEGLIVDLETEIETVLDTDTGFTLSSQAEIASEKLQPEDELPDEEGELEEPVRPAGLGRFFTEPPQDTSRAKELPTLALLLFWSGMSLLAFSFAGERMPWLTTHITMPMILTTGWALGYLIEKINWQEVREKHGWLVLLLSAVFFIAFGSLFGSLLGTEPPFQGKDLLQLQATSDFLLALVGTLGAGAGLFALLKNWGGANFWKAALLAFFGLLSLQTARTAYRAAYINYDNAMELLVYAHATRDMKDTVEQIETISKRLYGDKTIKVAYDNDVRYPYWWYMRDYPNKVDFDTNVSKSLQDSPIIVVGSSNFSKIEPVVRDGYYRYDYKRMWWPNESLYRDWSIASVLRDWKDPAKRSAIWQLWFNRDYTQYAIAFNNPSLTLATWSPSDTARMYIKKDVAAMIWEYGVSPEPEEPRVDPYAGNTISLEPLSVINYAGETTFNAPRDIATAADGSLFVADSRNHRIVHLDSQGLFLNAFGGYGNVMDGQIPGGLMNEPWGVAVGPDGNVYVADTWNHRIQVFTTDGQFLRMWSVFEVNGLPDGFWGPRGIALDASGRVFVTDTGKQRVIVFDANGTYLTQFGSLGLEAGNLDEPVGIEIAPDGKIYIADTWNYRVQVFEPDPTGLQFRSAMLWEVDAWSSDTLENKPFLALDKDGNVYITDPDRGRVIGFDGEGNFKVLWGGFDNSYLMGVISGIATTADGKVWVSDATSNTLLLFQPPD